MTRPPLLRIIFYESELRDLKKSAFSAALKDTIPVMTGYLFLGGGFGILMSENGFAIGWSILMAICMFAGSGQYLAVGLLASRAGLVNVAVATLLVNARHIFYGISLVDTYKNAGLKKYYMIFGLTDETYSLVTQAKLDPDIDRSQYCFFVTLLDHCYWICGCTLGSILGATLPISFEGVDFVLTALFVTMFVEQWLSSKNHLPALVGLASTTVCLLLFGSEYFLIPSMILIAVILILIRGKARRTPYA